MNDTLMNRASSGLAVPLSAGTLTPSTRLPFSACDCHMHVYADRFPVASGAQLTPPEASTSDDKRLQQRIGTTRTVLMTPSTYGTDNRCMLEGLLAIGSEACGVAVINGRESTAGLRRLDRLGVSGIRIKPSGGYLVSERHSVGDIALDTLARSYITTAPEHIVGGSDWPHATATAGVQPMPDDVRQVDRLVDWTGNAATLQRVLVDNPQVLYGFPITPLIVSERKLT